MVDFFDDLTVFVISTGEDTLDDCLRALGEQDCSFHLEHIRDVYPMSVAFQAMPDRCQTPYFIQVDADMILYPHAIRTLYNALRSAKFFVYLVYAMLLEDGYGVRGSIKAWKREIFKWFEFKDSRTVDRSFARRVRRFGFRQRDIGEVLGIHKPYHTSYSEYLKAKSDIEKWRFLRRPAKRYALGLLNNSIEAYPESKHQFFGVLLGSLTGRERLLRSKDARLEDIRYRRVLDMIALDENLSGVTAEIESARGRIIELFISCYGDDKKGRRAELVQELFQLCAGKDKIAPYPIQEFLEIVDL